MRFAKVVVVEGTEVNIRKGSDGENHMIYVDMCIPVQKGAVIEENFITAGTHCEDRTQRDIIFDNFDEDSAAQILLKAYEEMDANPNAGSGDMLAKNFPVQFRRKD